jgi:hypothetical protein
MKVSPKYWKTVLFYGLGLASGAAFCMKWMEADFVTAQGKFTILGLELFYSKEKIESILYSLDDRVKTILQYHLYFDYAFMAGIYPTIVSLGMMVKEKFANFRSKKGVAIMASLQLVAWIADLIENYYLLKWIVKPMIGDEFGWFHFIVSIKWIIALAGVIAFVPVLFKKSAKVNRFLQTG